MAVLVWDGVEVLTIDMAMQHGRVNLDELDDLQLKLRQAHQLVLAHVHNGRGDDEEWTAEMEAWTVETAPKDVQAAVQCQFLELVRFRGDDEPGTTNPHALSPFVVRLLHNYHTPSVA